MASLSNTSTHSSDVVDDKNAPSKTTKESLFRRATYRLRWLYCAPADTDPSNPSGGDAGRKDDKDEAKDEDKDEKPEDQTMKAEFKHLDRKFDSEDQPYFIERKKEDIDKGEKKDWWRLYAFCVVRRYDADGDLDETYLYVNPPPLRQLLHDVIGQYPTDPIDVDDVQIMAPYHSLFYYRKELEEVGLKRFEESGDTQSLEQLKLLLGWIKTTFELEIAAYDKCMSSDLKAISYDNLWTVFMPGTIVHTQHLALDRAFSVAEHWYDEDDAENPAFNLRCNFVDYDGDRFGIRRIILEIPKYSGVREIRKQDVKPLELLENIDEVKEELMKRGRKFEQYAMGQNFMQYTGLGFKRHPDCPNKYLRFDASGRVMIDVKTFHRLDANDAIGVSRFDKDHDHNKLTDEDRLLTNTMVRGYSLNAKKFLELSVDNLSEIEWNAHCFDELVLDPAKKKTVQALVSTHSQERELLPDDKDTFDDIVKGKGRGLVCVLHGPPGVGKTLTAECVAEYVQRPLFMVSSGDLGVTSEQLDDQLTRIMDMTSTWRAVLLIDEADVFLEQRALHDLHRNAMVSVFLRVLEYYAGILFLTTNRVATFDDAFNSRIHIPIRYTDLDVKSRLQIWRSFCKKVPGGADISDAEYEILAEHDLNGRQIKNVIKAAESLAAFDKVPLDFKQLDQVTKIQATFEKDLESFGDIDYTAPGSAKKHAASGHMYY